MLFVVQHRYRSDAGGPWDDGQELELTEVEAARFNADSPGVLKPKKAEPRQAAPPANDRQVKTASKRSAAKK